MKKIKRKYTHRAVKIATEAVSDSVKEESSIIGGEITPIKSEIIPSQGGESEFSFEDLPLSTRTYVEGIIKYRKLKGLLDDSKIRKERAIKYFRGDRPR